MKIGHPETLWLLTLCNFLNKMSRLYTTCPFCYHTDLWAFHFRPMLNRDSTAHLFSQKAKYHSSHDETAVILTKLMLRNTKVCMEELPPECHSLRPEPIGIGILGSYLDLVQPREGSVLPVLPEGGENSPHGALWCQFIHCDLLRAHSYPKLSKRIVPREKTVSIVSLFSKYTREIYSIFIY